MTIDVKAMRERAHHAKSKTIDSVDGWRALRQAEDDRAQLLALVDRQTALLKDARADLARQFGEVGFSTVEDIDDLLRDLDGDARGGGR